MRQKIISATKYLAGLSVLAILGSLFFVLNSKAITSYPPAALLGRDDITEAMVRNGALGDQDFGSTSPLNLLKIGKGMIGSVPVMGSTTLKSSTTPMFVDLANNSLFIGSTTPSQAATSSGSLYVTGTTTTQNLVATSSLTLNGVNITINQSTHASGSAMASDGFGKISFVSANDWIEEGTCTVSVATTSCFFNNLPTTKIFRLIYYGFTKSIGARGQIKLNGSGTGEYGHDQIADGVTTGGGSGDTQCDLFSADSTGDEIGEYLIINMSADRKLIRGDGVQFAAGSAQPTINETACVWNNTATLTSIQVRLSQAATYGSGSHMKLYRSND